MTFLIRGRSRIFRPKAAGSGEGEGPWYSDGGCGIIIIDGVEGEQYVLWSLADPNVVGSATLSPIVGAGYSSVTTISLITVTGDGEFQINQNSCVGGGLLAHLLPVGSPITTTCG